MSDDLVWLRNDTGERWTLSPDAEVIDARHPDYDHWREVFDLEDLIAGEAPAAPALPSKPSPVTVPAVALALSREAAAASLGVSEDTFDRHVVPHLRVVPVGTRRLIPVRELERYLESKAARALR